MLTTLVALTLLSQGTSGASVTPAQLVSRMLARYASATSLSGTISYTQSAGSVAIHGQTQVQYVKPDKLFIKQTMEGPQKGVYRVVSDGEKFSYSLPQDLPDLIPPGGENQLLVEPVLQKGKKLDLVDIYTIGSSGLVDKPAAMDIAIGRVEGLRSFRSQLATVRDEGVERMDGVDVHIIAGDWRQYESAPVSGTYRLGVTDAGDLVFYSIKEVVADPQVKMTPQEIVTTWKASLKVNGPTDPKLFQR